MHIFVQPIIRPTVLSVPQSLSSIPSAPSLLQPPTANFTPGVALVLLPYGTPACYVASYSGPTQALRHDFEIGLTGVESVQWTARIHPSSSTAPNLPEFLIVMLQVKGISNASHAQDQETKDDEGSVNRRRCVVAIWPTSLCMLLEDRAILPRTLDSVPTLPPEVQRFTNLASPSSRPTVRAAYGARPPRRRQGKAVGSLLNAANDTTDLDGSHALSPRSVRPASSLGYHEQGITSTATQTNTYVTALVRHRNQERERLKRDRELALSPQKDTPKQDGNVRDGSQGKVAKAAAVKLPPPAPPSVAGPSTSTLSRGVPIGGQPTQDVHVEPPSSPPVADDGSLFSDDDEPEDLDRDMMDATTELNTQATGAAPSVSVSFADDPFADLNMNWPTEDNVQDGFMSMSVPTNSGIGGMGRMGTGNAGSMSDMEFALPGLDLQALGDMGSLTGMGDMGAMAGMGFSLPAPPLGAGAAQLSTSVINTDFDFDSELGVFTAADFSFFNNPSSSIPSISSLAAISMPDPTTSVPLSHIQLPPVPVSLEPLLGEGLTPSIGPAPFGVSPPTFPEPMQPSLAEPWSVTLDPSFIPTLTSPNMDHVLLSPNSIPVAPAISGGADSSIIVFPATPDVQIRETTASPSTSSTLLNFDPVLFAAMHRASDDKYTSGKFAIFPRGSAGTNDSQHKDHDGRNHVEGKSEATGVPVIRWRHAYDRITDPRLGVVRKILEHKAHSNSKPATAVEATSVKKRTAAWVRDHGHEEWMATDVAIEGDNGEDTEMESPEDSDDDMTLGCEQGMDDSHDLKPSSHYSLPGANLLATHFNHACLLSLSVPAPRPSPASTSATSSPDSTNAGGAAATASGGPATAPTPAAAAVPTPLSPAILHVADAERMRNLEAAVQVLATELVMNPQWAQAWATARRPKQGDFETRRTSANSVPLIVPMDVWTVSKAIITNDSKNLKYCTLRSLSAVEDESLPNPRRLESPHIWVGKCDSVIRSFPTALRFWEKLGLQPRGGKKDVLAFVFFDQTVVQPEAAHEWMDRVGTVYEVSRYAVCLVLLVLIVSL
jgi:mediator of RNA polymerase II transcription subunit 13